MSQEPSQITGNHLLAALPRDAYERLRPHLEPVTLFFEVVYESGGHINILDRQQLLAYVCECYQVVKAEHERLLG